MILGLAILIINALIVMAILIVQKIFFLRNGLKVIWELMQNLLEFNMKFLFNVMQIILNQFISQELEDETQVKVTDHLLT